MMTLNSDKTGQAEYDRFLDLMAKMYLKYGDKYRLVTANARIAITRRKGLSPPSAVHLNIYFSNNIM